MQTCSVLTSSCGNPHGENNEHDGFKNKISKSEDSNATRRSINHGMGSTSDYQKKKQELKTQPENTTIDLIYIIIYNTTVFARWAPRETNKMIRPQTYELIVVI